MVVNADVYALLFIGALLSSPRERRDSSIFECRYNKRRQQRGIMLTYKIEAPQDLRR